MKLSKLVRQAVEAGVCMHPRDEYPAFVLIFKEDTFCVPQSASALYKLLDFLEDYGGVDPTEYVALISDLRNLGGTERIYWVRSLEGECMSMDEWLQEEHMRSQPKPILRGPFKGGQLIPSYRGFQKIVRANGNGAGSMWPDFAVDWMVNDPL